MSVTLVAQDATAAYSADAPPAISNVDLEIRPGSAIGIVGESGSGKTTIARMLAGFLSPIAGSVTVNGRTWASVPRTDAIRGSVQFIFQDPYGSLNPWQTVLQSVSEAVQVGEHVTRRRAQSRAKKLLESTGLSRDVFPRRPRALSGGQCQRVGIARALASQPQIIIADEPTSAVDVSVQAQILNLLLELQQERHLGLVLISHDLAVVRHLTDDALVVYRGRVLERGPTETLLLEPAHPYTRLLLDSLPGSAAPVAQIRNEGVADHSCRFAERCSRLDLLCDPVPVTHLSAHHEVVCRHPLSRPAYEE